MITADGPLVLEYNVRFGDPETQPLLFRLRGDLAEALKALAGGSLSEDMLSWEPGASVCVVAASGGYPGAYSTGKPITGLEEIEAEIEVGAEADGAKVFHAGTARRDNQLVTAGGRVLGITARGPDLKTATRKAYEAASKIHFEGMHFRRDIARKGLLRAHPL